MERILVTCPCGLSRALPENIQNGDSFKLVPCIRCGQPMEGTLIGDHVEVK